MTPVAYYNYLCIIGNKNHNQNNDSNGLDK